MPNAAVKGTSYLLESHSGIGSLLRKYPARREGNIRIQNFSLFCLSTSRVTMNVQDMLRILFIILGAMDLEDLEKKRTALV